MEAPEEDLSSRENYPNAKEQSEVVYVSEDEWGPVKEDDELYTEVIVEDYHNAATLECESVEITIGDGSPTSSPSPHVISGEDILDRPQTTKKLAVKRPLERNTGVDLREVKRANTCIYVSAEDLETPVTSRQRQAMSASSEQLDSIDLMVGTTNEHVQAEVAASHVEEQSLHEVGSLKEPALCATTRYPSVDVTDEATSHEELVFSSTHVVRGEDPTDTGIDTSPDKARHEFAGIYVKEEPNLSEDGYLTDETDDSSYSSSDHPLADQAPACVEEPAKGKREILSSVVIDGPTQPLQDEYTPVYIKEEPLSCEEEFVVKSNECKPRKYIVVANKELREMTIGKQMMDSGSLDEHGSESSKVATKTPSDPLQENTSRIQMYSCPDCPKCFISSVALSRHQSTHREKRHTCSECGKQLSTKSSLVRHCKSHTGLEIFSCSDCGKLFTYRANLVAHQKTHTGQKPHPCPECGKCFTVKTSLVRHQLIHTGLKPYFCAECGKCFTLKSSLLSHQKRHLGVKPFSCTECNKSFTHASNLISHQRTHTGEKPFPCPDCGKCFGINSQLLKHQERHTKEKPFPFPDCDKRFTFGSHLTRHQESHTKEKLFLCTECGKSFISDYHLKQHQKSHEGDVPFCAATVASASCTTLVLINTTQYTTIKNEPVLEES